MPQNKMPIVQQTLIPKCAALALGSIPHRREQEALVLHQQRLPPLLPPPPSLHFPP